MAAAKANPGPCGSCKATFRPLSRRCRECKHYKPAHCEYAKCPLAGTGDTRCADCPGPIAHGRSCTNCQWNGKGMPVCWACKGPNQNYQTDGHTIVTLGALDDPDAFLEEEREDRLQCIRRDDGDAMAAQIDGTDGDAPDDSVTPLPPEAEKPMLTLLHILASMTRSQLLVFHGLLNGQTQTEASKGAGFTKQNGSKELKHLTARLPQLRAFIASCNGHTRYKLDVA